jgi:N-acetylneuraminate synthase
VKFLRLLYFCEYLKAGDSVSESPIVSVRPGCGLPPKHFDALIGKVLKEDVEAHTATNRDLFEK